LNNCLTIDGLNKPSSTLNWAQVIALTRASDGTVFSLARTGGAVNPSITFSVTDTGGHVTAKGVSGNNWLDFTTTAFQIGNATDNPSFSFLGAGAGSAAGTWTYSKIGSIYSNGGILLSGAGAMILGMSDTTQGADAKAWQTVVGSAQYSIAAASDSGSSARSFLTVSRSGFAISEIDLGNTTDNAPLKYAAASALREVGFRNGETNVQNTPYTLQQSDGGRVVESGATAGGTITVPQLAQDTLITYINGTGGAVTLAQGSGVTLRLGNSAGTTGNRTVAQWAAATIYFTATTVAYVFGGGVT
jgi:hypothetical protein